MLVKTLRWNTHLTKHLSDKQPQHLITEEVCSATQAVKDFKSTERFVSQHKQSPFPHCQRCLPQEVVGGSSLTFGSGCPFFMVSLPKKTTTKIASQKIHFIQIPAPHTASSARFPPREDISGNRSKLIKSGPIHKHKVFHINKAN